jgi:L-serine dehydratase
MISVFDIFKIGIGPSSSHTVGPMRAAAAFAAHLPADVAGVTVRLLGSLAWTGKGHASDKAVVLGLAGLSPETVDPDKADALVAEIAGRRLMTLPSGRMIAFDPVHDIILDKRTKATLHPNTMIMTARNVKGEEILSETWASVGGGFVVKEGEALTLGADDKVEPFPFHSATELLGIGVTTRLTISEIVMANEVSHRSKETVIDYVDRVIDVMMACIDRGIATSGELPGGLKVQRRAPQISASLKGDHARNLRMPHEIMDWVSLFAMAVNEENAAGGRVVTAPTNGAAGVVPAVLRYYRDFCTGADQAGMRSFLLAATAIGALFKTNASISGAEVGCQGEVGVASSMAAAGLAAALGGTNAQVENAAEIGMEHHLGMTCDPVGGLVQIPCIERNAFGAISAINAASLALRGDGNHKVSLDQVIKTMLQTGRDMASKYKETSRGGLAVNVIEC